MSRPGRTRVESSRARRPDRAARREALLDAAIELIRTEGPDVSMEQLAAAGGVTKPILYRHFGDRVGLVVAIGLRFAEGLNNSILESLSADADNEEMLRRTIDAYLAFVERDTALYRFLLRSVTPDLPLGGPTLDGFVARIAAQIALVIGERLRAAGDDPTLAAPWSHALVGAVHQAGDWWIDQPTATRLSRVQLVESLVALVWTGLAAREAQAGR